MLRPDMQAPDFKAKAIVNGQLKEISLSDYRDKKYVLLFFYPMDFTFVCPTEITGFDDRLKEFETRNVQVIGVSTDSHHTHRAWIDTPREKGGLGGLHYPLVADFTKQIARDYGVLLEGGMALRGTFLIDKQGKVQHMVVNNLSLGRSTDEALRMIDALQYTEEHGEVCPMDWKPGKEAMKGTPESVAAYMGKRVPAGV